MTTKIPAEHAERLSCEDLPAPVIEKAGWIILDNLGCALAGSHTELVRAIDELIKEEGGKPNCALIGRRAHQSRYPPEVDPKEPKAAALSRTHQSFFAEGEARVYTMV